jgi:hypothetical protein
LFIIGDYRPSGEKPGIEIWRIEKFKVIRKAASDPAYKGKFFAGDAYIILQTRVSPSSVFLEMIVPPRCHDCQKELT